jgi:hypothetical protein
LPDIIPLSRSSRPVRAPVAAANSRVKKDASVVRSQFDVDRLATSLSKLGGATVPGMQLDPTSDTGTLGDRVTADVQPVFRVKGAPPNSVVALYRDGSKVDEIQTGPTVPAEVSIADTAPGLVAPGLYQYQAFAVQGGRNVPLGVMPLQVVRATDPQATAPTETAEAVNPATSSEVERQLAQRMLAQTGAFGPAPVATATPAPVANQVNLNQYFGKGSAPRSPKEAKHFSLFHHKKARPVTREVQVSGLSADAFLASPAAVAPQAAVPPGPAQMISGTGVGIVPGALPAATAPAIP